MIELKDQAERKGIEFPYADEIGAATIDTATCEMRCLTGTDGSFANMLSGNPFVSGTSVFQFVVQGLPGLIYEARCLAMLSDGRELVRFVVFRVSDIYQP